MRELMTPEQLRNKVIAARAGTDGLVRRLGREFVSTNPGPYSSLQDGVFAFDNHDNAPPWPGEWDDTEGTDSEKK